MTITRDEILAAIRMAEEARMSRPPNTYTRIELDDLLGTSKHETLRYIKQMHALGLLEYTKINKINSNNAVVPVSAYTLNLPSSATA
jgi:hypothetical protein